MNLLTFNAKLDQIEAHLGRIADAMDRAVPFVNVERAATMKKRGPEAIVTYGGEGKWLRENVTDFIREKGLSPEEEQNQTEELYQALMSDELLEPEGPETESFR